MSDNPPVPNRPKLDIPKEIQIPGTKVKVPTWIVAAAGVLLVVLIVMWQKSRGGEVYEPEFDEEGAIQDEIQGEEEELAGTISGPIEDIPSGLPAPSEDPLVSVPDLAGYEDQPLPPVEPIYDQPVYPDYSYVPRFDVAPGDVPPAAPQAVSEKREIVGQATGNPVKTSSPRLKKDPTRGQTATSGAYKPPSQTASAQIKQSGVTAGVTKQTPLGRVSSGVKKTTAPTPDRPAPKPSPVRSAISGFVTGLRTALLRR